MGRVRAAGTSDQNGSNKGGSGMYKMIYESWKQTKWKLEANKREEWAYVVKEAKVLTGP
jgi:hypothetical protein